MDRNCSDENEMAGLMINLDGNGDDDVDDAVAEVIVDSRNSGATLPLQDFENEETISTLVVDAETEIQGTVLCILPSQISISDPVGEGAWGVVHKGRFRGLTCAVKKLKSGIGKHTEQYKMLILEVKVLTHIGHHPNLVRFMGACLEDLNNPVIVQEYMEGGDLETHLNSKRPRFNLGQSAVHAWSLDILSALDYLHSLKPIVMHRDLKPANILLTRDRRTLKLADFGFAKAIGPKIRLHSSKVGALRYMAPEVLRPVCFQDRDGGQVPKGLAEYTEKADIYSAAIIIWYLLTGVKPTADIRKDPTARPDTAASLQRWPALGAQLEIMWDAEPGRRMSARECLDVVKYLTPAPGGADSQCCVVQ